MNPKRLIYIILPTLVLVLVMALSAAAQAPVADVHVYSVDTSQFPLVRLRAAPTLEDHTVATDLGADAFHVYENGTERPIEQVGPAEVGAQIAVILDASSSINGKGATGKTRWEEAIAAITELTLGQEYGGNRGQWMGDRLIHQLMLVAPKGATGYQILQDWDPDPVNVYNAAYLFDHQKPEKFTALYVMLVEAMTRMKAVEGYSQRPKFLVVLSDGVDKTSVDDITDVINRANAPDMHVAILGIKLGPPGTGEDKNLPRLARQTRGAFTIYTGADSLKPLYNVIGSQRALYEIAYRSAIGRAGKHAVEVGVVLDGRQTRSQAAEVSLDVREPQVTIVEPASGIDITRKADRWDANPSDLEPKTQSVTFEVAWPDGHPRGVQQISYVVDGVTVGNLAPDQNTFIWDISSLSDGDHSLLVEVKDELGLTGRSDPLQVKIRFDFPPAPPPTSTPTPTPTPTPEPFVIQFIGRIKEGDPSTIFPSSMAFVALVLSVVVVILLIKRPPVVQGALQTIAQGVKEVTDPFIHRGRTRTPRPARASLMVINDDGSPGEVRPITSHTALIGRDPARSQIVFQERTVSRLHAKIVEETNGVFRIYDEGSMSGTYINDELVPPEGCRLKAGDEIELGQVRLRFQPQAASAGDTEAFQATARTTAAGGAPRRGQEAQSDATTRGAADRDRTEPYVGR